MTAQRDRAGRVGRRCPATRKNTLLDRADRLLIEAMGEPDPRERFRAGYLAALRGAGAVLAVTSASAPARAKNRSAWVLMARAAPEFVMWSDYFAGFSATRAALEAGINRDVAPAEADEFCGRVGAFLHDVEDLIGDDSRLRPMDTAGKTA
ncbi:SAV_6107 family HEPN domain-containing protein [Aldersonia kunmingensis]|uniref:SAV_6107 family HEPN domain-containing protein n=1 Tax=Aldersonia kunmingensis TaxID=408066 RepID=UPI00316AD3C2